MMRDSRRTGLVGVVVGVETFRRGRRVGAVGDGAVCDRVVGMTLDFDLGGRPSVVARQAANDTALLQSPGYAAWSIRRRSG